MRLSVRLLPPLGLLLTVAISEPAAAFNPNPDWPCVQRKIQRLSWGQMWSGPPLPEEVAWRGDPALARLVPDIAARRTPLSRVRDLVSSVEATETETRDARLIRLFAGVFEIIDTDRTEIVSGIERYARNQRGLAEKINAMREEMEGLRAETAEDDFDRLDRIDEMEDAVFWETKIYSDRKQALTAVCESPVILEKRAFAVAKIIQGALAP